MTRADPDNVDGRESQNHQAEATTVPYPEDMETYREANHRRDHRVRVLRRGTAQHQPLADKLEDCQRGHRCDSEACPICEGHFRRGLHQQALPILQSRPHWTRASVIPAGFLVPAGRLHTTNLPSMGKRIQKRFERSSLRDRLVFSGVDISFNLMNNTALGWQFHIYAVIEGQNTARLREAIRSAFPPESTALKPYDFAPVTSFRRLVTYVYKAEFVRRSAYTQDGKARTSSSALRGPELRELLLFLDKYSKGVRLVLRGVRRNGKHIIVTGAKK